MSILTLKAQINLKHHTNVKNVAETILQQLSELDAGVFKNELTLEVTYFTTSARIRYKDEFEVYVLKHSKADYCRSVLNEACIELSSLIDANVYFEMNTNTIKIPALI